MAQDPFQADQFQVEPGQEPSTPRLIRRATDGSLEFLDALITGGITLSQLAGLRSIQNILVVGQAGAGAEYTTIQSALDAIPVGASPTNPYFVLIGPGVYNEDLNIVRDGVFLLGFGAVLASAETTPGGPAAYHTIVVQAALGTIPKFVVLRNLIIQNIHTAYAAIRVAGAAASEVAETGLFIEDCRVQALAAGGNHPIWADSVNHITVRGGSLGGAAASLNRIDNCASFRAVGVTDILGAQLDFDTTGDVPSEAVSSSLYELHGCPSVGVGSSLSPPLSATLSGRGSLEISGCSGGPAATFAGDRTVRAQGSRLGNLTLSGSTALSLVGSQKGTVTSGGTATMEEPIQRGAAAFTADITQAVVFDTPQPDADYTVDVELDLPPANDEAHWITLKTAAGFTINFTTAQTLTASWAVKRVMGGATN